jgi:hypothetical protein
MTVSELTVTALAIESILYVLLAAATLKRGNLRERVVRTLSRWPGARLEPHNPVTGP